MNISRTRSSNYPGKDEILAVWKWGVSKERTPITTSGEATTAMDLAYQAFRERDEARAALGYLPEQLEDKKRESERLRAEARRALDERNEARDALKVATAQRTAALVLVAVLLIILAFAL